MRGKIGVISLAILLSLTGCTQNIKKENSKNAVTERIINETDKRENTSEEAESASTEADVKKEFSFMDLKNTEFTFSSGAGGWSTSLYIYKDGSFDGVYSDSDMGDSGDAYPNGTRYYSSFSGQFNKNIEVVDSNTVRLTIDSITCEDEVGKEEYADNVRYVYSKPYGIGDSKYYNLYLPGKAVSELSEDTLSWIYYGAPNERALSFYCFENVDQKEAFSSVEVDIKEHINTEIANMELLDKDYENKLQTQTTQQDLNLTAEKQYVDWNKTLNHVWKMLAATCSKEEMEALRTEEKQWIKDKDAIVESACKEYEGGSMYDLIKYTKAAEVTKKRVYELQKYVK